MKKTFLLLMLLTYLFAFVGCQSTGDLSSSSSSSLSSSSSSGSSSSEADSPEKHSFFAELWESVLAALNRVKEPDESSSSNSSVPSTTRPPVVESPPPSSSAPSSSTPTPPSSNTSEVRAIWITQFEIQGIKPWEQSSFRSRFATMMKNCRDFGLNTVYVQVRPNGDSFYPSAYYPWSHYVSGSAGTALNYDPLAVMIEEAHRYGLKFHAWINPYRLQPESQMQAISNNYQTKQWYNDRANSDRVVVLNNNGILTCFLNPAYPEARQLIFNGVKEIVSKYNVDGMHIDDYFYPTRETFFDAKAYAVHGGGMSLDSFRYNNVNLTVKGIYDAVKSVKPQVVFGVSPAGNMNNLPRMYADVKKWASTSGYLDYIIPQLYWDYDHNLDFGTNVVNWNNIVTAPGVKLIPGLAAYKVGTAEWQPYGNTLARMVQDSRNQSRYGGFALYRYMEMFVSPNSTMLTEKNNLSNVLK